MDSTIPTTPLVPSVLPSATVDACPSCGAAMAFDQRYCLHCGQRRGEPRLPVMSGRPAPAPALPSAVVPPAPAASRVPAGTTLLAGVGTLLLALGVGVLIGTSAPSNDNPAAKAPVPQVITVAGAAAGPTDAGAATPAAAKAAKGKKGKSKSASAAVDAAVPKSGTTIKKTPGKVVKLGQKGHGRGYSHGKFTGDFFGQ